MHSVWFHAMWNQTDISAKYWGVVHYGAKSETPAVGTIKGQIVLPKKSQFHEKKTHPTYPTQLVETVTGPCRTVRIRL